MSKKLLSFITIFSLIMALLPLNVRAAEPATNLTIHKIVGATESQATYGELTGTTPPAGNPVPNISFTYWKVTESQFNTMKANPGSYQTAAQVSAVAGSAQGTTAKTAADGTVKVNGLAEGYYWFIEDASTGVKASAAVPFGLDLPVTNESGAGYITDLHVYPKNTLEDVPSIDKDVATDGNKSSTFDIGQAFNWIIQPTVPKGIDEYTKFTVKDTLNAALDFQGTDAVTVTSGGTALTAGTDYNVTFDNASRQLTVDFTTAGLKKLTVGAPLNINVSTAINDQAVMGQNIVNNATLDYDTSHGNTGTVTVAEVDRPEVHTGGKQFKKTDGNAALSGAQFVIKKGDQYLHQDANLAVTWGARDGAKVFNSAADGLFEVKGLAYGDYVLEETQAPAGYTLPTNPTTSFTVNASSYTDTPSEIINKKSYIPNTGGIGTIIFTVIGLLLMALALFFFKKRQQA